MRLDFCKEAIKALHEGVKRGDSVQILDELDYHITSINLLECKDIFYIEQLLSTTDNYFLVHIFSGQQYRFNKLKYTLNKYHTIENFPPNNLNLDMLGYDLENFKEANITAKARFEKRENYNGSYRYRP